MLSYILKRLAIAIPTLLVLIVISFLLMHSAPGGPFTSERELPPQVLANLDEMDPELREALLLSVQELRSIKISSERVINRIIMHMSVGLVSIKFTAHHRRLISKAIFQMAVE